MNRNNISIFCMVVLISLALSACGEGTVGNQQPTEQASEQNNQGQEQENASEQKPETVTLVFADPYPETNFYRIHGSEYFMQRAEELSDGALQFDYFPGEQLGKANQMLSLVQTQTADISLIASAYVSDKMPLNGVAELPGTIESATQGSEAIWEISREGGILWEPSFLDNDVRPLFVGTSGPYPVFTTKKKIEEVADWKGLKIRTSGGTQELSIAALGGTPVSIPAPDLYSALERNTVDGGILSFVSWPSYQIDTLAKYSTTNAHLGTVTIDLIINDEVYKDLPAHLQDVLVQASLEMGKYLAQELDKEDKNLRDEFENKGIDMYELTDGQLASWNETMAPVADEWVQAMNKQGLPGQEVLDAYKMALDNGITWE